MKTTELAPGQKESVSTSLIVCTSISSSILILLLYFQVFDGDFIFDDKIHIVASTRINSLYTFFWSLLSPLYPGNLYRPLLEASYAFTVALCGKESPVAFHVTNAVLHSCNVFLLLMLFRHQMQPLTLCFFGIMFAVHPLHSEAVANISGRSELLAAFFGLLSLLTAINYLKQPTKTSYLVATSLSLFLSFLSKESALVFPGLLVCISRGLPFLRKKRWRRATLSLLLCYTGVVLTFIALRFYVTGAENFTGGTIIPVDNPLGSVSTKTRVITALWLLWKYIILIVIPFPLSADYSFPHIKPHTSFFEIQMFISHFLIISLLISGIILWYKRSSYGNYLLWYFIAFSITSNIFFPIGTIFGERLTYLPSIGLIASFSTLIQEKLPYKLLRYFFMSTMVLAYATMAFLHIPIWQNDETLWNYQMEVTPKSSKTLLNYGVVLLKKGDLFGAKVATETSIAAYKWSPRAYANLGTILIKLGNVQEALKAFDNSLKLLSSERPALIGKAKLLYLKKRNVESLAVTAQGLNYYPHNLELLSVKFMNEWKLLYLSDALDTLAVIVRLKSEMFDSTHDPSSSKKELSRT